MRRSVITAVLAALVVLLLAPPATAKGPSGVLITDPRRGTAVGVSGSDGHLMELYTLLEDGTDLPRQPRDLAARRRLSLFWVAGDRYLLRTEQVVLDTTGAAYVVSFPWEDLERVAWRRVADPARLTAVLTGLGALARKAPADEPASGSAAGTERAATARPAATVPTDEAAEPAARWVSLDGWRWAVPGLGLGLLLGVLVTRGALRRTTPLRG